MALATETLRSWIDSLHRSRRQVGSTVTFGTTEFTGEFLGTVWATLRADFERRAVHLKIDASAPATCGESSTRTTTSSNGAANASPY